MAGRLTDRETVAGVLALMVRDRCIASKTHKTSRTGLHLSVPVSERPAVRRGLDALVELGILAAQGEDIGLTSKGRVFVAHVQKANAAAPIKVDDADQGAQVLVGFLAAIAAEPRLQPERALDEVITLPGRLERLQEVRESRFGKKWYLLGGLAAAVAVVSMIR